LVGNKNIQTFATPKDKNVTLTGMTVKKGKYIDKMGKHLTLKVKRLGRVYFEY
jgi:hypothetical protein